MEYSHNDDLNNLSLTRFESMLKTNDILFFDSNEFENIIHHYLDSGKIALAKKAIKLGLEQHPTSVNLQLFKVEILVIENKFTEANNILNHLHDTGTCIMRKSLFKKPMYCLNKTSMRSYKYPANWL